MDKLRFALSFAVVTTLGFFFLFVYGTIGYFFAVLISTGLTLLNISLDISVGVGFMFGVLLFIFLTLFSLAIAKG